MSVPPPQFQSNYPRQPAGGYGFIRPAGVYFDSIGTAFEMIKADFGVYAVSSLIVVAITGALSVGLYIFTFGALIATPNALRPSPGGFGILLVVQLAVQAGQYFIQICLIGVGVRHALGNWPAVTDLFIPFKRLGRALAGVGVMLVPAAFLDVVSILSQPGPGAKPGDSLFLLPWLGLALIFWLLFGGPIYLAATAATFSDLPVGTAITEAFRRPGWHSILLSILVMVAGIVSAVGILACCVGIVFTLPVITNVIALHYTYYFPPVQPEAPQNMPGTT